MAFTNLRYGFYNYDANDTDPKEYDAEDVGMIFDGIITDGIYENYKNGMFIKATTTPYSVIVSSGRAWFDHTWSYVDTDTILDMSDSEYSILAPYKRIDAIVLDVDTINRTNKIAIVKGTEISSGTPEKPSLINEYGHVQHGLAFITREGGVSVITQDKIEDVRGHATYNSAFVTGVLSQMTIDDIVAQWETEFDTWSEAQRESFLLWRAAREDEFVTWFNDMKDQLSEDAAGHLQEEIDVISNKVNSITFARVGTASATEVSSQKFFMNNIELGEIDGSAYLEQQVTLSDTSLTSCTFTNNRIQTATGFNIQASDPNVTYTNITINNNEFTITFDSVPEIETIGVRLFLNNG